MLLCTAYGMPPGNGEAEPWLSGDAEPGSITGRGLVQEQEAVRWLGLALELTPELLLEQGQERLLEQGAFKAWGIGARARAGSGAWALAGGSYMA